MMEVFEHILDQVVAVTTLILETISVLCIIVGLVRTGQLWLFLQRKSHGRDFPFNQVRLAFGSWLAMALEFQLGADILATTVAPSAQDLVRLGLIALIRTFLNYFLGKEMVMEMNLERERERLAQEKRQRGMALDRPTEPMDGQTL